jgi:hypothetical protein
VVLAIVLAIRPLSVFAMFGRDVAFRYIDRRWSVPIPETGGRGALGTKKRARPPADQTLSGRIWKWRSMIERRSLSWQENVVVSWTGMRGVVTLLSDDEGAFDQEETRKAERAVHDAADEVLAEFRAHPPEGLDPRILAEIRNTIARHSQDADEMPDPDAHTSRAEVFAALYRDVLSAQRAALIAHRDEGRIDDEAVRAMLERLDLQEAGVTARLDSRF